MSDSMRLRDVVRGRIHTILPNPENASPTSKAVLANLRRGVGKQPGAVPQIWQHTHVDGPDGIWTDRREQAVHLALTQWAMHQQSQSQAMHNEKRSFGEALRLLARFQNAESPEASPAYSRMMALAGSRTLPGITTHARGLIGQLRAQGIAFDYGRWAEDLLAIQTPGRQAEVQRRWGRDFYRLTDPTDSTTTDRSDDSDSVNVNDDTTN